jgi:hypothetical protein
MLMKRRERSTKGRGKRKADIDIIYDYASIDQLLADMTHATAEDRRLNQPQKPATNSNVATHQAGPAAFSPPTQFVGCTD